MSNNKRPASDVLAAMADGIGDLCFASEQWVDAAAEVLATQVSRRAEALADLRRFTICEVAHNPPAYLHCAGSLAWHAVFEGSSVTVSAGELPDEQCDFKMQGDHSIISNLARIQYHARDPDIVARAQARLTKLSRWQISGQLPEHPALAAVLRALHDTLATRTMPRFVFMTPEWVSSARQILSSRAVSAKYADGIKDTVYTFSEEFTHTPRYAFPDGAHGGFWVHCNYGDITVGAGPLPKQYEPADMLTRGEYTPVVPVGRTVNRAMTDADKEAQLAYSKVAFRYDKQAARATVEQTSPSGKGEMGSDLGRIFIVLHDELSKRTSGELPADFDAGVKPEWAEVQAFDRNAAYDPSWLRYDKVDIYGDPIC